VSDPPEAPDALVIAFFDARSGNRFDAVTEKQVGRGDTIEASVWSLPGTYGVIVNDAACDGVFDLAAARRTNLVLRLSGEGCSVDTLYTEPL
jgi:hypothetical protein